MTDNIYNSMREQTPLLRVLRGSSADGTYLAIPHATSANSDYVHFSPVIYADKSLRVLLNGVLIYVLFCVFGLAIVSMYLEGIIKHDLSWWLIFMPFWLANIAIIVAHIFSIRHAKKLQQWADVESMSNEPLLPLLRRIVMVYAISMPLTMLLLWSEVAFCAQLASGAMTTVYISYFPLLLIEMAFIFRYLLCRSDSTLPGICWILTLIFTVLLAYQTETPLIPTAHQIGGKVGVSNGDTMQNVQWHHILSWSIVLLPLFAFEGLMAIALLRIWYNEFTGMYHLTRWQFRASVMYAIGLVSALAGELMLLEHFDYHWGNVTFPYALMLLGFVCVSIAIYVVGRWYVSSLMATRGGAIPVPLTRTSAGWTTSHAKTEHWILLGNIDLTNKALAMRQVSGLSDISMKEKNNAGHWFAKNWQKFFGWKKRSDVVNQNDHHNSNTLQRNTSGSYAEIDISPTYK